MVSAFETTNPFLKTTHLPDNCSETDNDNTGDNSLNSPIAIKLRESSDSKQTLWN